MTFMEVAHVIAKRSTCFRLNVGAVITVNNRIVCTAYNGVPAGETHCTGNDCPGRQQCFLTVHAEDNALRYLPKEHRKADKDLYVTHSPCFDCAKLLLKNRVKRVFFTTPYRITDSLDWLLDEGISVYQSSPAGYCMEWRSRNLVDMP